MAPEGYVIRDATKEDMAALTRLRNAPEQFVRYLRRADGQGIRFLVCETAGRLCAFVTLFLRQPKTAPFKAHIPAFSDLYVDRGVRSQGIGSTMITYMERLAVAHGHTRMYVGVAPLKNPRALALYERLGYVPLQDKPYERTAVFYDETGNKTLETYWRLDLVKTLGRAGNHGQHLLPQRHRDRGDLI